jgi:SAM-dependent methyltransferase
MALASEPNHYSPRWFDLFLPTDAVAPAGEVAFLVRRLGPAAAGVVLDAGAGTGRHALALAAAIDGQVLAVDRDRAACARCRARSIALLPARRDAVVVLAADLEALPLRTASLDAVLSLWQSFGYGGHEANATLLAGFARVLRPGGRLVLDLYHRGGQRALPLEREMERDGYRVRERRRWTGTRLEVALQYEVVRGGRVDLEGTDRFHWEVYEPDELTRLAARAGLRLELACACFSEAIPAGPDHPRMQLVYVREGSTSAGAA